MQTYSQTPSLCKHKSKPQLDHVNNITMLTYGKPLDDSRALCIQQHQLHINNNNKNYCADYALVKCLFKLATSGGPRCQRALGQGPT